MKRISLFILALVLIVSGMNAQQVVWQPDVIIKLTPEWKGERYPDGRPKVPDAMLERLKNCAFEEVQAYLGMHGYRNVFENFASLYENGWHIIHPERVMTGRALTAQFMPMRPDFNDYVQAQAKEEGTHTPVTNYAPIIKLQEGDTMVLYTDGITEAWDKAHMEDNWKKAESMFGDERLNDLFRRIGGGRPEEVKNGILAALQGYQCHDDVTMVILKRVS